MTPLFPEQREQTIWTSGFLAMFPSHC